MDRRTEMEYKQEMTDSEYKTLGKDLSHSKYNQQKGGGTNEESTLLRKVYVEGSDNGRGTLGLSNERERTATIDGMFCLF